MFVPEVSMSATVPFEPVSSFFERNLSIRHVYGEPVHHGETTIIPVAKVAYGFGAGGSHAARVPHKRRQRMAARSPVRRREAAVVAAARASVPSAHSRLALGAPGSSGMMSFLAS